MIKRSIRRGLQGLARRFGLEHKLAQAFMETSRALEQVSERGVDIASIIDVGASDGRWSESVSHIWPKAHVLLVEANPGHEPALRKLVSGRHGWNYTLAAASAKPGTIRFDAADLFGGLAHDELAGGEDVIEVPAVTIDGEVERLGLPGPYLLKLDTHGVELAILDGAAKTLSDTSVLVIEAYNFRIAPQAPRFWELCAYLEQRGFLPIDLTEPLWRPYDGALWQFDLVFIRSTRQEFEYDTYT